MCSRALFVLWLCGLQASSLAALQIGCCDVRKHTHWLAGGRIQLPACPRGALLCASMTVLDAAQMV